MTPLASAANGGGPNVHNARDYVQRVKNTLGPASLQYRLFLSTLRGYRLRELTPSEVIDHISQLFRGNIELLLGFSSFLPPGYQIVERDGMVMARGVLQRVVVVPIDDEKDEDEPQPRRQRQAAVRSAATMRSVVDGDESDEEGEDDQRKRHES